jgi:immune inhibitor A
MYGMIRWMMAIAAVAVIAAGSTAQGVALSDEVVRKLQQEGTLQTWMEQMNRWRAAGMDQPLPRKTVDNLALSQQTIADSTVVILVDFYDQPADAKDSPAAFDSLLFSLGKNPTGSMKEYYLENSYGQYLVGGKAFGWYRAPANHQSYDGYDDPGDDGNFSPAILVRWAIVEADLNVDFSQFDTNHDGFIDGIIVVHSGYGAEESGNTTDIWSHMSNMAIATSDGVTIRSYTIQPEKSYSTKTMSAIGVFCHEWGHILGLPDVYDTDGTSEGVGNWSLMGAGNYNGGSKRPAHLDAWCKEWLGWVTPVILPANTTGAEIPAIEFNPIVYRLAKNGSPAAYEYFLVENREKIGFDDNLPGEGLLIYHIDNSVTGNSNDWHPRVFLEQADGKFDLQNGRNRGDAGDPYPGADSAREFNDITVPDSRLYNETSSQVAVWNIPDPDSVMTVDFDVFFSRPLMSLASTSFNDQTYGDGDGTLDPGEKIQVSISLTNEWAAAAGISEIGRASCRERV